MEQIYRDQIGIDPAFVIKKISDRRDVRKGQDADVEVYDVFNAAGMLVAQYEIYDSTGMYPPHSRTVSYRQLGASGNSGQLTPAF